MREDPTKTDSFKDSNLWNGQRYVNDVIVRTPDKGSRGTGDSFAFTSNSLSGRERNRLFLQHADNFSDVTLVSGADDLADGRSFGLLDFNQDGWLDIALMTLNAPRFKLYQNEIGGLYPDNKPFRFRLVGGQTDATPSRELSNRDGIGARVTVTYGSGKKIMLQNQSGEGFSSQNSKTRSIGIPKGDSVVRLDVRWPSGRTSEIKDPDQNQVCIIEEVNAQ